MSRMDQPSQNEIEIFNAALDLAVPERSAYLTRVCVHDTALRLRVEALLRADEAAGGFLEGPAFFPPEVGAQIPPRPTFQARVGERIASYLLLQEIGEGGCGVVYRAMQEAPVRREVALKVTKLGMDTKNVLARFEAERQALALMDHPNIARVLDAGMTEGGRPFFVMELVRGIQITNYCDENRLSIPDRLALFIQVCRAVQHAHQKGVIHRDLKPSNILVTTQDGVPMPRVIDFGIAKATQGRLVDHTILTTFGQFIGTPAYMSPEQAEEGALDIDTRSDIYSLGVLLYELLTGQTPFAAQMLPQAGLDEIRRAVREKEPLRPSACLRATPGSSLAAVAGSRRAEPSRLVDLVTGDLDWIVIKALEKKRDRRYETANGFAADVQRHLDDEPVVARPPGRLYTFQKTVRRHKLVFAIGTLALLAIIVCLGAAVTALMLINRARRETVEELRSSYLAEARATRLGGRPGQRFASLAAARRAAAIRPGADARDEAIACLAVPGLAVAKEIIIRGHPRNELARVDLDLERYAFRETNGNITLRSAVDDHFLSVLPAPGFQAEALGGFSRDGRFLSARYWRDEDGESDWVWDVAHQKPLVRVAHHLAAGDPWIFYLADDFSADGRFFFSSHADGSIAVYDLPSGRELRRLPGSHPCNHLILDPAGNRLACASRHDARVDILDVVSGRSLLTVSNPPGVSAVAWSSDGRWLAAAGLDFRIGVWDSASGRQLGVLAGHSSLITSIVFNHAGDRLASSGYDDVVRLWDVDSGRQIAGYPGGGRDLQFSPDDRQLLGWQDISHFGSLAVADSRECRLLGVPRAHDFLSVPAFSSDGGLLAVVADDEVGFWDAGTGAKIGAFPLKAGDAVCFTRDGKSLITVDRLAGVRQRTVEQVDGATSSTWRLGRPRSLLDASTIQDVSVSQDGRHLAVTQQTTGQAFILDLQASSANVVLAGHPEVDRIALSPDGRWAATGSWYNSLVKIWDARTGALVRSFSEPARTLVSFSPDGRWLATSSSQYRLWEVGRWQPHGRPEPAREDAGNVFTAFSQDGRVMARTAGNTIRLLRTDSGALLATLEAPGSSAVYKCQFSPDGSRLAAVQMEKQVQLWDLRLVRLELAGMHLDWDLPPDPPPAPVSPPPARLEIDGEPATARR